MVKHMKLGLLAVFLLVSSTCSLWSAQSGRLLPFQGRITGASGVDGVDGVQTVQFKMYDAPVGGRAVWNGEVQRLTVNQGLISTVLGSKASLEAVDFGAPIYLEMTLDANGDGQISLADPPLLPRQTVSPSVFSVEAANSRKLAGFDWKDVFAQGGDHPPTALIAGNRLVPASVKAEQIAPQTITAAHISPASITGALLVEGTLSGRNLAPGSIDISSLAQAIAEGVGSARHDHCLRGNQRTGRLASLRWFGPRCAKRQILQPFPRYRPGLGKWDLLAGWSSLSRPSDR
jgi:hypothetical protein